MLIGIDASRANREHKSGTEWYSYYLIRWLAKLDSKNQYILYTDKPLKSGLLNLTTKQYFTKYNNETDIKYNREGYQIIKSPYNNFRAKVLNWPFCFFWTLGRLSWEMLIHRPDVLFIPSHTLPIIYPEKTINTIHDVAFERDRFIYRKDAMGPRGEILRKVISTFVKLSTLGKYGANSMDYLSWSTRFALKHAKIIITVSKFSKSEILAIYNAKEDKIKVIYNGYNKSLYCQTNEKERADKVLKKYEIEEPYILYVGRLEKKKNTPLLIEAFAIARENKEIKQKLILIGDASFGYDEVKDVINEYNLVNDVIMPGWIEEEDLPYIFNRATAFIFPSNYEGFGIPLLQAMACKVPIAASSIPVLKEVAEDAALFFNPNDADSIAQSIKEIILNDKLREELIKKGNERVKEFSWEICARKTLEVINRLGES
ncbi:MAG: glycosyltransferase family 1 protein [Patescibacteria group bacterium]